MRQFARLAPVLIGVFFFQPIEIIADCDSNYSTVTGLSLGPSQSLVRLDPVFEGLWSVRPSGIGTQIDKAISPSTEPKVRRRPEVALALYPGDQYLGAAFKTRATNLTARYDERFIQFDSDLQETLWAITESKDFKYRLWARAADPNVVCSELPSNFVTAEPVSMTTTRVHDETSGLFGPYPLDELPALIAGLPVSLSRLAHYPGILLGIKHSAQAAKASVDFYWLRLGDDPDLYERAPIKSRVRFVKDGDEVHAIQTIFIKNTLYVLLEDGSLTQGELEIYKSELMNIRLKEVADAPRFWGIETSQ